MLHTLSNKGGIAEQAASASERRKDIIDVRTKGRMTVTLHAESTKILGHFTQNWPSTNSSAFTQKTSKVTDTNQVTDTDLHFAYLNLTLPLKSESDIWCSQLLTQANKQQETPQAVKYLHCSLAHMQPAHKCHLASHPIVRTFHTNARQRICNHLSRRHSSW